MPDPDDEPPAPGRFGRRAKVLALAAAAVIVAGAVTIAAVATGNSDDAAASVTPTATAAVPPGSAPAPAPTASAASPATPTATPSATPPASKRPMAPPTTGAAEAPAPHAPRPTATVPTVPTKHADPAAGPRVFSVSTDVSCSRDSHTAKAVVLVTYDGSAAGKLHLTWWRSSSGRSQGATAMTPQTATFPKGSKTYVFTSTFAYKDGPGRSYVGVTVSTDPAAVSGSRNSMAVCR